MAELPAYRVRRRGPGEPGPLRGVRCDYRAAHFVNNMMSQGAVMIDDGGVVRMRAAE